MKNSSDPFSRVRLVALLTAVLSAMPWSSSTFAADEVRELVERNHPLAKTTPTLRKDAGSFHTLNHCPVMGNGCTTVVVTGSPDELEFAVGKNDFWMDRTKAYGQSWQPLAGVVRVSIPAIKGATFKQQVHFWNAEVHTRLEKEGLTVDIRSVVPHESARFLIQDLTNAGSAPFRVQLGTHTEQHRPPPGSKGKTPRVEFQLAAGVDPADAGIAWATRKTPPPEQKYNTFGSTEFRMWAALATRVYGAACTGQSDTAWDREGNDWEVGGVSTFEVLPGQTVRVVTKIHSTGIPITPDPTDPLPHAIAELKSLDPAELEAMIAAHRTWWQAFWRKSWICAQEEPVVERTYYGALYILGCATRVGDWPCGGNGFPVDDYLPWGGDYHWNYNNEAVFYGVYSANRVEQSEPYDRTVRAANEYGRKQARSLGLPGTLFSIATAPGHLNESYTLGQRTHALEAAMNQVNRYYHTYDLDWMKQNYAFLRDVADFWDHDLLANKEQKPNGCYRYVVVNSLPMEGAGHTGDNFNSITSLAFLRRFYQGMIDITRDLNAAGFDTGRGEKDLARWNDFLLNLADYPMSFAYGRKVLAWSESTLNPLLTEQSWLMYPIFPGEQIHLSSDPKLLAVARNTLIVKPQYYFEWLNNPVNIFSIAARLAHHPPEVTGAFRLYFGPRLGVNHFASGGANTEGAGVLEGINSFFLQSQEGFLRLFPCWDHPHARFERIRAVGAMLVSAEKRNGVCQPIRVTSEKGRPCRVLNPWPGQTLTARDSSRQEVAVTVEARPFGQVCVFATRPGEQYTIAPKTNLPQGRPYWNAALGRPATASSNRKPPGEADAWDVDRLTDGIRINTKNGHRGWTSGLHDKGDRPEWVQIDLGGAVPIKSVALWALDHGDAWQHTHCMMPFVISSELDQSYDGFPLDLRILVSNDGSQWDEVAGATDLRAPVIGGKDGNLKPGDTVGPEMFRFKARAARYVKLEITQMRRTRSFDNKYAACLAEIEVHRAEPQELGKAK